MSRFKGRPPIHYYYSKGRRDIESFLKRIEEKLNLK
jgi:hypothetical protein